MLAMGVKRTPWVCLGVLAALACGKATNSADSGAEATRAQRDEGGGAEPSQTDSDGTTAAAVSNDTAGSKDPAVSDSAAEAGDAAESNDSTDSSRNTDGNGGVVSGETAESDDDAVDTGAEDPETANPTAPQGTPDDVESSPDGGASDDVTAAGGSGGDGTDEGDPSDTSDLSSNIPYDVPRDGPFKMLVYSRTNAFRTHDAIVVGRKMISEIATEYDFEPVFTETNEEFTEDGLAQYEAVFFLNTSGDVLEPAEELAFEEWMYAGGAFIGTHRATDTEEDWDFYKEVTGQFYDGHGPCCVESKIQWTEDAAGFPMVEHMPSPWTFSDEWFFFDRFRQWSEEPGFKILATVEHQGRILPVSFVRDFANFRSFYVVMGHQASTFEDPLMKQFVTGGILWSVRREFLLQ